MCVVTVFKVKRVMCPGFLRAVCYLHVCVCAITSNSQCGIVYKLGQTGPQVSQMYY